MAVLAVVAFHLFHGGLAGGYLGVDIFFVISGFLITGIIWREVAGHEFSLWRFYERRIRRIAPALLAVLIVVTASASAALLPVDLMGYARSLLATLGFVSNIFFWRDGDYFSRAAGEKPLLHTWSLGIEEQFYILFPLLLILCARVRRSWTPWVLAAVTLGSLAANLLALKIGAGLPAFFLLPTRAWELGVGALLVFMPAAPPRRLVEAAAVAGAVVTLAALILGDTLLPVALPPALPAVLGSALLIWSGSGTPTLIGRGMGLRLPVFVGLLSYSLYLWHWPLIVLTQYWLVRSLTTGEALALTVPMLLLAWLSWRFVERPFRNRALPARQLVIVSAGVTIVLAAAAAALLVTNGLPGRLNPAAAKINAAAGTNYRCPISDYFAFGASRACKLALPSGDATRADLVLLGNSHAQMYAPLVADILAAHRAQGVLVPANGCLPMADANINAECIGIAETNIDAVLGLGRARVVMIGLTWADPGVPLVGRDGRPAALQGTAGIVRGVERTVARLQAAGKRVIVIGPIATPGWDIASVLSRSLAFGRPQSQALFKPQDQFEREFAGVFDAFAARPGVVLVRPDRVQCRAGRCNYLLDGHALFADSTHIAVGELFRYRAGFEPAITAALQAERPSPIGNR